MSQIDLPCKLLCASEAAYCIQPHGKSGKYNPCHNNPHVTAGMIKQYNAIGLAEDPYIVTALQIEACLIGRTDSEIIVAFRGTLPPAKNWDSFFDWLEDAFAEPVSNINLPGKVHYGFLFALLQIAEPVIQAIQHYLNDHPGLPIYITGHSKGGGMAPIAAMYFKNAYGMTADQTITFAGPKPGDGDFCNAYNTAFPNDIRYENYLDIVPMLPPSDAFISLLSSIPFLPAKLKKLLKEAGKWDYETVGTLRYIDSSGNVNPSPPSDTKRFIEIVGEIVKGDISQIADAHHASCGFRYMEGTCQGTVCGS